VNTPLIERFREFLPISAKTPIVSLGEGGTPLVAAPRLALRLGLPEDSLYLKFEGCNPTGSFKDRGMTLAISKAVEAGATAVVCASTGNTAASAAAYAARAGLRCLVVLPHGGVALGKLASSLMYGAEVVAVRGSFDKALELVRRLAELKGLTIVNSLNPYRLEGQKTGAFEIVETLGAFPTHHALPVGNAGNITAYWRGYRQMPASEGRRLPKMLGFQAAGAAPLVTGKPVARPKTVASAIRIGNPVSWRSAIEARDESGGLIESVTDAEILRAYRDVARLEGVFCEPSSAAGLAGLAKLARRGYFKGAQNARIVAVLTGHGLKDPDQPAKLKLKFKTVDADLKAFERLV
jgi:threonine synthase